MKSGTNRRFLLLPTLLLCGLAVSCSAPRSVTPEIPPKKRSHKWWIPRHEKKVELVKKGNVDLVMIGDSITHGWEGKGKETWKKFYGHRRAINLGFSADRTENVLWRLQNGEFAGLTPKLAVIMIGTNNAGHRQEASADTALGIKAIIAELQKQAPQIKILVLAIFPRGKNNQDALRQLNQGTNKIISGYADNEKVFFLDINQKFLGKKGSLPRSIMPDLLHPNKIGYGIWAAAMEPMIKKLLAD